MINPNGAYRFWISTLQFLCTQHKGSSKDPHGACS